MAAFANELRACLAEAEGGMPPPPPEDDLARTLVTAPVPAPGPVPRRARPPRRSRRRRSPLLYVLLALIVGGAAFAAVVLLGGSSHSGAGPGGGSSGSAVQLRGLAGYDPQGDGVEHNETAALATDGSTATSWTTETYSTQDFGALKDGVGLVLDAGSSVTLAHVTVTTPTPGFTAEIEVGDSPTGGFAVDSSSQTVSGTTTFTLDGKSGQYYVVWITQLPPGNRAQISEVTATS
jgi:hypothetical protein